jgi:hypothetical protein
MRPHTCFNILPLGTLLLALVSGGCGQPKTAPGAANNQSVAVSNHLAAIASAGEPVTLDQLGRIYEEPPSAQNAALLYAQAFAALRVEVLNSPTFLAENQAALALLLKAAERPLCRYPVALTNGVTVLLPHLYKIKNCATLLRQEAISQAERGHTDSAATAILAGFRLARSLDNEPLLISKLVEIESLGLALDGLQESINRRSFTDAELLRLLTALDDAEPAVGFRRAMLGERANLVAAFTSSDEKLAEAMAASEGGAAAPPLMLGSYRSSGHLQGDFGFALTFMSNLVAVVASPYPQALDAAAGLKIPDYRTVLDGRLVVSAALLPEPARFLNRGAEAVARIRLARTVLAVERYRLKHHGALPASLADASAELSDGIPKDPFDGQPLRYRQLPTGGYAVWSVGTDRKDDGGSIKVPDSKTPLDVGITVAR